MEACNEGICLKSIMTDTLKGENVKQFSSPMENNAS